MKYYLFVFVLVITCVFGIGCEHGEKVEKPKVSNDSATELAEEKEDEAPLLLDDEPLLLLDDEPLLLLDDDDGAEDPDEPQADNSRCFVCHINYMAEDIAVIHARADIGCNGCHGESDEHIADESWASGGNGTAPDTMFPKPRIVPFCMGCHPKDKIDLVQHKPLFANIEKMVCTDCHGEHRLPIRRCKWK